jgi:hypothetical protein
VRIVLVASAAAAVLGDFTCPRASERSVMCTLWEDGEDRVSRMEVV